jgi:hypothetical protein
MSEKKKAGLASSKRRTTVVANAASVCRLSKSKLLAFRQCERRLWLEVHMPAERDESAAAQARFDAGHRVGEVARWLYDPKGRGTLIDPQAEGFAGALQRSSSLLASAQPLFEAEFSAPGGVAFADVMLPVKVGGRRAWRMVEVKSSTSVKDYHRDDVAMQAHVARTAGVPLAAISVACLNSAWVYPGGGDYRGLFAEQDLTEEAFARGKEVQSWIEAAQAVVRSPTEPDRATGGHCTSPFECGYVDHCSEGEPQAEYPVTWLPRVQTKALKAHLAQPDVLDMRDVPDELLNPRQVRVTTQTLRGKAFIDRVDAARALAPFEPPLRFLDFETIHFAVPIWAGTRPYQQLPFQFSLHALQPDGSLQHREFLDASGNDPSAAFVDALVNGCGTKGAVFVYNAAFEKGRMKELAGRLPKYKVKLASISARVVDLLPIAEVHYYHPSQQGSWSIKKLLPAVVPSLRYDALDGVQDGGATMTAYLEAIDGDTPAERKAEIERQLLAYCGLDTYAMVKLWQVFAKRLDLRL